MTLNAEKIKRKKINIKLDAQQDFYINSDNYLIVTIFRNIISNALKYSNNNGEVAILLFNENHKISCKITDNGIGINKQDLEAIYNPFFRSNSSVHPEIKGTGLGLSIVKRLSELLQISFQIESEIGIGTTVILKFDEDLKTIS